MLCLTHKISDTLRTTGEIGWINPSTELDQGPFVLSVNSVLSVLSVNSVLSVLSVNSVLSVLSVLWNLCCLWCGTLCGLCCEGCVLRVVE